ncbi:50S ribosomal protein L5 [candidate division WOR-1 bacterium RIFCSPHIGHO2_01_FULL_53_15]|uniref:Large ribosomal subunit protein uL5 n=1 Tax=candidate division WOR-1 bacterium RIFCSPHIGHO2_01_FULL_53_15 TaxID=1802564 RepID=A0A1F4Q3X1_UNCSA|nr:MAG: 50S ribosomal protein L5 [candidate division WOR-1 bacterium RIFCSPHIGHO2_01_FULL_53_15]OGC12504.1 MAG: 50S ribosomal protein L5 [candidate division WOR-1 bacterium RIFCSPHIGHO2_02_FULL_53_26]
MTQLKEKFDKEIVPKLIKSRGYKNRLQAPRLVKMVLNRGVGEARENEKAIDVSAAELAAIAGQKPLVTKSKKAISAFKLKGNIPIGLKVTLRGDRMYEFLNKFINICLPRIRDFKGVSLKSFDGRGNYTLGIREQLIFPEVDYEKVDRARGMDITFVTSAETNDEARELLELLGLPFRTGV